MGIRTLPLRTTTIWINICLDELQGRLRHVLHLIAGNSPQYKIRQRAQHPSPTILSHLYGPE